MSDDCRNRRTGVYLAMPICAKRAPSLLYGNVLVFERTDIESVCMTGRCVNERGLSRTDRMRCIRMQCAEPGYRRESGEPCSLCLVCLAQSRVEAVHKLLRRSQLARNAAFTPHAQF